MTKQPYRIKAPKSKAIENIPLPVYSCYILNNGVPVYIVDGGNQPVVKTELLYKAGSRYQKKNITASLTNQMLSEGTKSRTSEEIAEGFEFLGSHLQQNADRDFAEVTLYSVNKFLDQSLELMSDVIFNPVFPEQEFQTLLAQRKQKHQIDNEKVRNLASRKFNEVLFGKDHVYGISAEEKDFDKVRRTDLASFHKNNYTNTNLRIILAGNITADVIERIGMHFGGGRKQPAGKDIVFPATEPAKDKKHMVIKAGAVQSAIRIGCPTIHKSHPDYAALQILNTILGGYFGSRLMSNLREDKGYTYGIGSGVVSFRDAAYFTISTEVGAKVTRPAVNEIYKEIELLRKTKISTDELDRVKSYLMGEFLRMFDGPFACSDSLKAVIDFGLDYTFFKNYILEIKNISPAKLLAMAKKYLSPDSMYEVVAGQA